VAGLLLLDRAFRALGVPRPKQFGFHALCREFATDLMSAPVKVVAKLGGWKDHQTMLHYPQVSERDQRTVLNARRLPSDLQQRPPQGPEGNAMGPARFERATSCSGGKRSIQLSYGPFYQESGSSE
jgi:hypothetical protein